MSSTGNRRKAPIRVTFDCNTYSAVARPNILRIFEKLWPLGRVTLRSRLRRIAWWYIQLCIKRGRVIAAIPEALLTTEVLSNKDRVDLLLAVGTNNARPTIPTVRIQIIKAALAVGFKVLHMPRIAHAELFSLQPEHWANDDVYTADERHNRQSAFLRHFNDYAFEAVRDFGAALSTRHGLATANTSKAWIANAHGISLDRLLWREGLAAENLTPLQYTSADAFHKALRKPLSDWTDFDVAVAHYGYGYDYICTEDKGRLSSNSIFGAQHATGSFDVLVVDAIELAGLCWRRFKLPIQKWRYDATT